MTVLRVRPALIEVPPFHRFVPRLSERVAAEYHPDGGVEAGSMPRALAKPYGNDRAMAVASRLVASRLGGRYWAAAPGGGLLAGAGLAVVAACGDEARSRAMLATTIERVGAGRTLLLMPDRAMAALRDDAKRAGCRVSAASLNPWPILDAAAEVHVASAEPIGVLALLAGVAVHCHAAVWFSGRGLTTDHGQHPAASPRGLARLAAAALLDGVRYRDPFTGQDCDVDRALDLAAEWRRVCDLNRTIAACVGMQAWKRRRIQRFLHCGSHAPRMVRSAAAAIGVARGSGGAVAGWASRLPPGLGAQAWAAGVAVVRVEDGFLRSVGLGSDFLPPCSIVLDRSGLYYDPAQPSDLETLLADTVFTPALLARAAALVRRVTQAGLTKYNVGSAALPPLPAGRTLVLVPGQVADDLSVTLGGGAAAGNADLLRRVRAAEPDAFIIYRPHPDVDAGHRPGALSDAEVLRSADTIARDAPMAALIAAVDEVHTMTSLAGFEALLRGRRVTVWGRPFYAGWGLTHDMAPIPRRTRSLCIEALAAGVLLLYPRYLDPVTLLPCPAETLVDRLATPELWRAGPLVRLRRLQGRAMAFRRRTIAASPLSRP